LAGGIASALVAASVAFGAPGQLSPRGCLDVAGPGGPDDCGRTAPGLDGASDIAISPDGRSVYVTAFDDDAIVHLRRNRSNGSLRAAGCIEDEGGVATGCARSVDGLNGAIAVEVSPNGRHVYTVAYHDSTLLHFKRNPRSGKLVRKSCIDDADLAVVDDVCPGGAESLSGPQDVALSPDARSLYVPSQLDSGIVTFNVNRRGKPRFRNCIEDDDKITDDCPGEREGLFSAQAVTVTPNGRQVYVAASGDSAIVHFGRNRRTGSLGYRGCVDNRTPPGPDDCARTAQGIREAHSLAISPDGRFLNAGANNDGSMATFKLNRRGVLRSRGCVETPFSPAQCGTVAQGMGRVSGMAFDSRGTSLFVAGGPSIQPFKRGPRSAELTEKPCIQDDDRAPTAISCARTAEGLSGTNAIAISPDDRWVYTASTSDSAVAIFRHAR